MLIYLATRRNLAPMNSFLESWAPALRDRVKVFAYEEADTVRYGGASTVVFSDCDSLPLEQRAGFGALADALQGRGLRVLNHPSHVLGRLELLQLMHKRGQNLFRALTVEQAREARFPVFVRFIDSHDGPQSPLLYDLGQLEKVIAVGRRKGVPDHAMLIVEFCSTRADDGVFHVYSAFCVAGEVVPRQVLASQHWVLREPDLVNAQVLEKEKGYLAINPHAEWIAELFKVANIEYGRMDYSVLKNRPQIWEINTNPPLLRPAQEYSSAQLPNQQQFARQFLNALQRVIGN